MSKIFFKGRIQSYIVCYGCHQSVSVLWLPHNLRKAPLQFASVTRLLYPAFLVTELCKYTHRKINYGKIQNKQLLFVIRKLNWMKMNFSYGRKFPQKWNLKIFTKKFVGGGVIFPGSIFPGGEVLFLERISRTYALQHVVLNCFEVLRSNDYCISIQRLPAKV